MYLSLFVALAGLLTYALTKENAKVQELGRIAFGCGLLAFLLGMTGRAIEILTH